MIRGDPNIQKCPSGQKERTMKRLLCMILAIMMLASLTAAAFADSTAAQDEPLSFPLAGVTYDIPEKYRNLKGHCDFEGGPAIEEDLGIVNFSMEYYAVADEDIPEYSNYSEAFFDALLDGKEVPVPTDPSWDDTHIFTFAFEVYGLDGGRGEKELRASLTENGVRTIAPILRKSARAVTLLSSCFSMQNLKKTAKAIATRWVHTTMSLSLFIPIKKPSSLV